MTNWTLPFVLPAGVAETRDDHRDRGLFAALAAGDPGALAELYDRHAPSLFRHGVALSRNRSDAEDLVQALFLKVASIGAPLLGVRAPASYLHRILHTLWIDGHRRAKTSDQFERESVVDLLVAPGSGPDTIDVARALAALPDEQREVVILHAVDGFSFREIGGMTGVSMFTAAARYRLATGKLRARLDPQSPHARQQEEQ